MKELNEPIYSDEEVNKVINWLSDLGLTHAENIVRSLKNERESRYFTSKKFVEECPECGHVWVEDDLTQVDPEVRD